MSKKVEKKVEKKARIMEIGRIYARTDGVYVVQWVGYSEDGEPAVKTLESSSAAGILQDAGVQIDAAHNDYQVTMAEGLTDEESAPE